MTLPNDRAKRLFLDAIELEEPARTKFLTESYAGDDDMKRRVDELLRAHLDSDNLFGQAHPPTSSF